MLSLGMTLTQSYLKSILDYNQVTGDFTWRYRSDQRPQWNAKFANKVAGCKIGRGYIKIYINGSGYYAHRLAVLWITGVKATAVVDHHDRNKSNNAWSNLRICSQQRNSVNRPVDKRSTTGYTGVYRDHKSGRWWSRIIFEGKTINLGRFDTLKEAVKARKLAERIYYKGWI